MTTNKKHGQQLTQVVHKRDSHDVYIGRPSEWGNPFSHKPCTAAEVQVASLDEAIAEYETYFLQRVDTDAGFRARTLELKGKRLACWCKPGRCHGDVIKAWLDKQ